MQLSKRSLRGLMRAFWPDWLALLGLLSLSTLVKFLIDQNESRTSFDGDLSYSYENKNDTIPFGTFIAVSIGITTIALALVQLLFSRHFQVDNYDVFLDLHHFFMGGTQMIAVCMIWTVSIKTYVGYLRPCALALAASNDAEEARKSYVSGHTSVAFSWATYLACYLAGKFGIFSVSGLVLKRKSVATSDFSRDRRFSGSIFYGFLFFLIPIAFATWVGASRVVDYKHHPADVNG